MSDNNQLSQLDILHKIETLTSHIDQTMQKRGQSVLRRYPLTFALLVLFGVAAVSEGVKGILELMGFAGHPVWMFLTGIAILVVTGTLYKKLDK
jgi:fumarate reductase subunit C